jgi:Protein of unknown function (DUF3592)
VTSYRDFGARAAATGGTTTFYVPVVTYEYDFGGRSFQSAQVTSGGSTASGSKAHAEKVAGRYPVGAAVRVRYNPENPGEAVLKTSVVGTVVVWLLATLLLAVAASLSGYPGTGL